MLATFLRYLARGLFVINPAAVWLFFSKGKAHAITFLRQIWLLYQWKEILPLLPTVPNYLPKVPFSQLFPDIDTTQATLLYPLSHPGSVSVEELVLLVCLVRHLKPKRLVEIGTAEGRTALNLALHAPPDAEILTLDLPPDAPSPSPQQSGPDYRQMGISEPGVLFRSHPLAHKIRLVLADSTRFDWLPYKGSVDFIFIDGAHDYESVRKDTENALNILRPGGIILWHDYGTVHGVTACLNDLYLRQRLPVFWLDGTTLACYRSDT
ncbi:MAG: class I SAM-dependent methyltransferase [Candidatus Fervidibacter sp.]